MNTIELVKIFNFKFLYIEKLILFFLLLFISGICFSETFGKVICFNLNMRDYPSLESNVIRILKENDEIKIIEFYDNNWCKAIIGNDEGYVSTNLDYLLIFEAMNDQKLHYKLTFDKIGLIIILIIIIIFFIFIFSGTELADNVFLFIGNKFFAVLFIFGMVFLCFKFFTVFENKIIKTISVIIGIGCFFLLQEIKQNRFPSSSDDKQSDNKSSTREKRDFSNEKHFIDRYYNIIGSSRQDPNDKNRINLYDKYGTYYGYRKEGENGCWTEYDEHANEIMKKVYSGGSNSHFNLIGKNGDVIGHVFDDEDHEEIRDKNNHSIGRWK